MTSPDQRSRSFSSNVKIIILVILPRPAQFCPLPRSTVPPHPTLRFRAPLHLRARPAPCRPPCFASPPPPVPPHAPTPAPNPSVSKAAVYNGSMGYSLVDDTTPLMIDMPNGHSVHRWYSHSCIYRTPLY